MCSRPPSPFGSIELSIKMAFWSGFIAHKTAYLNQKNQFHRHWQSKTQHNESKQMPLALQSYDSALFNICRALVHIGMDGNLEIHSVLSHVNCKMASLLMWFGCRCRFSPHFNITVQIGRTRKKNEQPEKWIEMNRSTTQMWTNRARMCFFFCVRNYTNIEIFMYI